MVHILSLQSAISSREVPLYDLKDFAQFIFDNADFNIATLTGHGTIHSLGGLTCVTPAGTPDYPQLNIYPKTSLHQRSGKCGSIPIQKYTKRSTT